MKKNKIYLGTVKRCLSADNYKKYGEERFIAEDRICSVVSGVTMAYAETCTENALLLKGNNNRYINIHGLSKKDLLLFKIGLSSKSMRIIPDKDDEMFVEETSLKPFYNNCQPDEKVKLKTLRKGLE